MRNGYIIDTLTSVDIQELVKIGGRLLKITKVVTIEKILRYRHLEKLSKNCLLYDKNIKTRETT